MAKQLVLDSSDITRTTALIDAAADAAREAGNYVHRHFSNCTDVSIKSRKSDVVTVHDKNAEAMIRTRLLSRFPDSVVCGEEMGSDTAGELIWFVDPIDGTSNFAGGLPLYCISIGVAWKDRIVGGVVYDAERDELFRGDGLGMTLNRKPVARQAHAREEDSLCLSDYPHIGDPADEATWTNWCGIVSRFRAVRRLGTAALSLAYVAAGRADVCFELQTHPWDCIGGMALVLAAGGAVHVADAGGGAPPRDWAAERYVACGRGFDYAGSCLADILAGTGVERPS
ncbi:MAG: inositol monophosphatase [Methylobacteriaceae bacterium]|jgi:myo-inositol-1(or 4)-monophosphatase|nr:inositol monophosphatase [Methylobacteriaceae bacterium]